RRIETDDAAAAAHRLGREGFVAGLLPGRLRRLVGKRGRDHDDAVAVAHDDVTRIDRDIAAADRHLDFRRLQVAEARGRYGRALIGREAQRLDVGRVPEAAIGDDAGTAARLQPSDQQVAAGTA